MTERPLPFVSVIVPVLNGERTLRACGAVATFAGIAARAAILYGLQGGRRMRDAYYPYLTFLRKLGIRIGFLWGAVAGHRR